jgi:hypothetical protein
MSPYYGHNHPDHFKAARAPSPRNPVTSALPAMTLSTNGNTLSPDRSTPNLAVPSCFIASDRLRSHRPAVHSEMRKPGSSLSRPAAASLASASRLRWARPIARQRLSHRMKRVLALCPAALRSSSPRPTVKLRPERDATLAEHRISLRQRARGCAKCLN